jgi:hypothetical protein
MIFGFLAMIFAPLMGVWVGFKSVLESITKTLDRLGDGFQLVLETAAGSLDKLTLGCQLVLETAAGSLDKLTLGLLSHLATLTQRLDISVTLLTNAILGLAAAFALAPLLHLSQFSSILRFIVWMMYASLCFSMILTYLEQQHFPEGE